MVSMRPHSVGIQRVSTSATLRIGTLLCSSGQTLASMASKRLLDTQADDCAQMRFIVNKHIVCSKLVVLPYQVVETPGRVARLLQSFNVEYSDIRPLKRKTSKLAKNKINKTQTKFSQFKKRTTSISSTKNWP